MRYFANAKSDGQEHALNICTHAQPDTKGTIKLSSTWNGGTETPYTFLGNVNAGVGTIKSAKAPAKPSASEAKKTVFDGINAGFGNFANDKSR
jgi:hypothetical protein